MGLAHVFGTRKSFVEWEIVRVKGCRKTTGKKEKKMTKAQRNELKRLIDQRTKWDAASVRISKTGGVSVKFDADKKTGLTRLERKMRVFIGHYPEILTHI